MIEPAEDSCELRTLDLRARDVEGRWGGRKRLRAKAGRSGRELSTGDAQAESVSHVHIRLARFDVLRPFSYLEVSVLRKSRKCSMEAQHQTQKGLFKLRSFEGISQGKRCER